MKPLVFQSDFGLVDGAVSAMYGVAYCVSPELKIHDLTHDITPYSIWEASYRLIQTISYWPEDTVFVRLRRCESHDNWREIDVEGVGML